MSNTTNPQDIIGKVLPRRVPKWDRTILALVYSKNDAADLRRLADGITLKGKKASMSTLVRRALAIYARTYARDPVGETIAMERLVTEKPQASTVTKKGGTITKLRGPL